MSEAANTPEVKKSPRRLARELAMQGLYEWRMSGNDLAAIEAHASQESEDYKRADKPLLAVLLHGAVADAPALEAEFTPYLDRPLAEISPIEYAIMLLATYELKHRIETPYRVVINEGIELTKSFGGTDAHRFVNGVLDKLAPKLRAAEAAHRG